MIEAFYNHVLTINYSIITMTTMVIIVIAIMALFPRSYSSSFEAFKYVTKFQKQVAKKIAFRTSTRDGNLENKTKFNKDAVADRHVILSLKNSLQYRLAELLDEDEDEDEDVVVSSDIMNGAPVVEMETENGGSAVIIKAQESDDNNDVHFCFLVHGYRGRPSHLSYLQSVMVKTAQTCLAEEEEEECTSDMSNPVPKKQEMDEEVEEEDKSSESITTTETQEIQIEESDEEKNKDIQKMMKKKQQQLVIYKCQCNLNHTSDGIKKGGERIYKEILSVIRCFIADQQHTKEMKSITISMVGNSLGGLYSRYALAKLVALAKDQQQQENNDEDSSSYIIIDGTIQIYFNIFCTTASPHLGISRHTWFPLPRKAEIALAQAMGDTGHDLFRLNELLKQMCTLSTYLKPLSLFQKRIAYANAYHTDFAVPTQTAAFLNPNSTYPHHLNFDVIPTAEKEEEENSTLDNNVEISSKEEQGEEVDNTVVASHDDSWIVATFHTPQRLNRGDETSKKNDDVVSAISDDDDDENNDKSSKHADELLEMSTALDELGWEKVFVDIRSTLPNVPIPGIAKKWLVNRISYNSSSKEVFSIKEEEGEEEGEDPSPLQKASRRYVLGSKDVANAFASPDVDLPFPIGHNMLVAVAGSRMNEFIYKGGRPVMDKLGKKLVEEILSWRSAPNKSQ